MDKKSADCIALNDVQRKEEEESMSSMLQRGKAGAVKIRKGKE